MSTLAISPRLSRDAVHRPGARPAGLRLVARPATGPAATHVAPTRRAVQTPTRVRLTRRGRAVVLIAMLVVVMGAVVAFGSRSAATSEVGTPVQSRTVEVGQGDTLWSIAADVAGPGEVRETVHRIEELNALSGPGLSVGQEIAVPVG